MNGKGQCSIYPNRGFQWGSSALHQLLQGEKEGVLDAIKGDSTDHKSHTPSHLPSFPCLPHSALYCPASFHFPLPHYDLPESTGPPPPAAALASLLAFQEHVALRAVGVLFATAIRQDPVLVVPALDKPNVICLLGMKISSLKCILGTSHTALSSLII